MYDILLYILLYTVDGRCIIQYFSLAVDLWSASFRISNSLHWDSLAMKVVVDPEEKTSGISEGDASTRSRNRGTKVVRT